MDRTSSAVPALVIAGTHSGVGKTTVTTALIHSFIRRGLRVQPFKVGPDFIDPTYHSVASGRPSYNLDGWLLSRDANIALYQEASQGADLCIIEGVMGLFDGESAVTESGSTAEVAKWLRAPVLLIADGSSMARSGAALVRGFESFDPLLLVVGVIFNRISGEGHYSYLKDSIKAHCLSLPLGHLPTEPRIALPERHLGLHLADETLSPSLLNHLADWVDQTVDLNQLLALARRADLPAALSSYPSEVPPSHRVRIAVGRDRAFQFYYQQNLDYLQKLGADICEFSPVHDPALPDNIGAVYLGGGYPELHAAALSVNTMMQASVCNFARRGGPIYAECGGFMYLSEAIVDQSGTEHSMCGLFPTRARLHSRLAGFGYAEVRVCENASWLPTNQLLRGHQFRYSEIDPMPASVPNIYAPSQGGPVAGFRIGDTVGSYFHLHFRSCPDFAENFVRAAKLHYARGDAA
jgi:cobyrinic acid a,c-diamide synthase